MKSIKAKITIMVLICTILSAFVVGTISIQNTRKQILADSTSLINQACENSGQDINAVISRIEQSVQTLADCAMDNLTDLQAFQTDSNYVTTYTNNLENIIRTAAQNTSGAMTAYIRYNPDFTEPTSGLFFSRDNTNSEFAQLVPTDFSIYEKTDIAHVGWYYIPIENRKATWMSPYLNENLQVYMISYVIPLYKDNVEIGIVGMDIDFGLLQDIVDNTKIYDTGYAFLSDTEGNIMYHNALDVNQKISEISNSKLDSLVTALQTEGNNQLVSYELNGIRKKMAYITLKNNMQLVLTAPVSEINASSNRLIIMIVFATFLAIIVSVLFALFLIRGIVRPIKELNNTAQKIAEGDLDVTVSCHSHDEIGTLAKSISLTITRLREYIDYINEITNVLNEIASGNLAFELQQEYSGEFSKIKDSLQNINHSLNHTLLEISYASNQVSNGSAQVAASAQTLSHGTTQQAASVQEISATIHAISNQVQQNAQNAQDAHSLASEAGARLLESNQYMQEMTAAMKNITETSAKISLIVKTVEDIASQTNILALNAAVESARAGETGKGFAVVADEVRSLAVKVGSATKDISLLVDNSISAIHNGTSIVEKTEKALETVVENSLVMEEKIQNIATASEEQAQTLVQVNQGIEQISTVVQSNSQTAQEEAAASEEMSSQAQALQNLISHFHLEDATSN